MSNVRRQGAIAEVMSMKITTDEGLHREHTNVLMTQLVAVTIAVLEQYGLFTREQNRDITSDLLFGICGILDGSAYPGRLNDEEIMPFVGFCLDAEAEQMLISRSGMHASVQEILDKHYSQ
jgi:hypothetical protein